MTVIEQTTVTTRDRRFFLVNTSRQFIKSTDDKQLMVYASANASKQLHVRQMVSRNSESGMVGLEQINIVVL